MDEADRKPRKTRARDLSKAITLRPAEVFALYGIPQATLRKWCVARGLPSMLIQGRSGRRGVRLVRRADLEAFLQQHRV